jgi:DNA-binding MarR family transcriptional regulator
MGPITYGTRNTMAEIRRQSRTPQASPLAEFRESYEMAVATALHLTRIEASDEGLSIPQVFILQALSRLGPVPIAQFVRWWGNSPSTIGGILDVMEASGIARRSHGTQDRRQVFVSLTLKGRRLARRLEAKRAARWSEFGGDLSADEMAVSSRTLRKITEGFGVGLRSADRARQRSSGPNRARRPPDRPTA